MNEIGVPDSINPTIENFFSTQNADGSADSDASDVDVQAFLEHLQGEGQQPTEAEMQKQFDKNFQTMSYQFMKGIYSYAEEEIRRQQ